MGKQRKWTKKEYFESLGYEVHYIWEYDLYNDYENTKKILPS